MRYVIQGIVMLSDLAIIGASGFTLYLSWNIFPVNLLAVFLVVKSYQSWSETGGFMAWDPRIINGFMRNARKIGL